MGRKSREKRMRPNDRCPICGKKTKDCEGHPRQLRMLNWVFLTGFVALIGSGITFFETNTGHRTSVTDFSDTTPAPVAISEEVIQSNLKFFDETFMPVINSIGDLDKIPPPLRNRYQAVGAVLGREYGGYFQLTFGRIHSYSRFGRYSLLKSIFKEGKPGKPYVEVFIPTLRELYEYLKKSGAENWQEQFRMYLYIIVLHEMEHFAAHHVETKNNPTVELEEEIEVWGKEAEYALLPIRQYDPSLLTVGDNLVLDKWLECGRRSNSDLWRKFFKDNIGFGR